MLGYEGTAARIYYSNFERILTDRHNFQFEKRDKRPPSDPVNAVMSYLYGVLVTECVITLMKVGFDPYLGFFHRPKYGRPALALDLMEEFRTLIADSVLIMILDLGDLDRNPEEIVTFLGKNPDLTEGDSIVV